MLYLSSINRSKKNNIYSFKNKKNMKTLEYHSKRLAKKYEY